MARTDPGNSKGTEGHKAAPPYLTDEYDADALLVPLFVQENEREKKSGSRIPVFVALHLFFVLCSLSPPPLLYAPSSM